MFGATRWCSAAARHRSLTPHCLTRPPPLLFALRHHASVPNTVPSTEGGEARTREQDAAHPAHTPPPALDRARDDKSQRKQDLDIIKQLLPNIWPKGDRTTKIRVLVAMGLLIGGKLLNVQVPFYFKSIVDSLNIPLAELTTEQTVWTVAGTAIVGCETSIMRRLVIG
jgi:hypothetical protein